MSHELSKGHLRQEIDTLLKGIDCPEIFGDDGPQIFRYENASRLISEAVGALKQISEFKEGVFDRYFTPHAIRDLFIPIRIGTTRYEIGYSIGSAFSHEDRDENLIIIKNDEERIVLHTYESLQSGKNGHISYSEDAPSFRKTLFAGDERAVEEAQRIINELKTASQ